MIDVMVIRAASESGAFVNAGILENMWTILMSPTTGLYTTAMAQYTRKAFRAAMVALSSLMPVINKNTVSPKPMKSMGAWICGGNCNSRCVSLIGRPIRMIKFISNPSNPHDPKMMLRIPKTMADFGFSSGARNWPGYISDSDLSLYSFGLIIITP